VTVLNTGFIIGFADVTGVKMSEVGRIGRKVFDGYDGKNRAG
jgi:hypothetical protein